MDVGAEVSLFVMELDNAATVGVLVKISERVRNQVCTGGECLKAMVLGYSRRSNERGGRDYVLYRMPSQLRMCV